MKRNLMMVALLAALHLGLAPAAMADSWTFTLQPLSGAITGAPSSTIGWGYTISNQSATSWLVLTGLSSDPLQHATPDASLFSFPILAPMSSLTVSYNSSTFEGLFQLTWDATAPVGFVNSGTFVLNAEFWDSDPLGGGSFLGLGVDQSAGYSAAVTPGLTPVPEPTSLLLFATGLSALAWRQRKRNVAIVLFRDSGEGHEARENGAG